MSKAIPQGLPASLTGGVPRRYPSDATRALRRRLQKERCPQLSLVRGVLRELPPHEVFAGQLLELAERAPDGQSRDELRQVVHNVRLRFRPDAARRRFAGGTPFPPVTASGASEAGGFDRFGSDEQKQAAAFAQELMFLVDTAPDEESGREVNAVTKGILLRFTPDEHKQRIAVLRALESSELLALSEVVELTRLSEACVLAVLGDFVSPEVGLAFEWTPDGKRRCGRGGTTRYFGLRR